MTEPIVLTREIGQTENALRAVLLHHIGDTPFDSYAAWVAMTMISHSAGHRRSDLVQSLGNALKTSAVDANVLIDRLIANGQVQERDGSLASTEVGSRHYQDARARVQIASSRLHDGLSVEDLETTRRTLMSLFERATHELRDEA